ncbi:MAG TPA: hypothetical protein PLF25_10195, partial [Accumulibacter sp.]|nr:hypothetical protein [Accumulibacter sp.]
MVLSFPRLPLPARGEKLHFPVYAGSSDALLIAEAASRAGQGDKRRLLVVVTASSGDAQRLLDEIPWFAAELRVKKAVTPDSRR